MRQKMWMLWAILGFDWLNVYKYLDETIVPFLRKGIPAKLISNWPISF
jgi:hypothetical protein